MKILFIRPPRYLWPWNSESSSFWQPLGFISMAAVVREEGFEVDVLDCLPLRMGWKSLKERLHNERFDILCLGDETASAIESFKTAQFVKTVKPTSTIIGGGYFLSYVPEYALQEGFDYIVRGEGEQTLLELVSYIASKRRTRSYHAGEDSRKIKGIEEIEGICFLREGKLKCTKERPPIELDALPMPAYDLLPMHLYGKKSTNHPDFAAIEHGRGCTGGCDFCSIFSHYATAKCSYHTFSPERSFEITKHLVNTYGRKTLNWTDGTFNLNPEWSRRYFRLLQEEDIKVDHTAWMRADCIVRDESRGIMKQMVDGGLVQAVVGMERLWEEENEFLNSKKKEYDICRKAFEILRGYQSVYTIATLIYGLPDDDSKKLKEIKKFIYKDIVDFQFILPFTPYPGTPLWEGYKHRFSLDDYAKWNLHRPVMGTKHLTREQLDRWFKGCLLSYIFHPTLYKRAFFERDPRKKRIQRSLAKKLIKGLLIGGLDMLKNEQNLTYGKKPGWYDS